MFKKILIGLLAVTVVGAGAAALTYQLTSDSPEIEETSVLANTQLNTTVNSQTGLVVEAQEFMAEPWKADGKIVKFDDFGLTLELETLEEIYVELGEPSYWQTQDVILEVGQQVTIEGSVNDGMYHAYQVMLADGQILQIRTETGQPLWAGGVDNGQGQNGADHDGDQTPDPQASVDDWVSITGTLIAFQGGNMTITIENGDLLSFQTGRPSFFSEQGVTFSIGDEITVVGFYEGEKFMAGDVTQLSTGLRVMMRDPNGRPLWAGPGGNGKGNGGKGGN